VALAAAQKTIIMMYASKRSWNGIGMMALLQAIALAASLYGALSRGSLSVVEYLSRQDNSLFTYTDYLGMFTIAQGSKSLDGQPAGSILAAELSNKNAHEVAHLSPNYAERAYLRSILFVSLIRSPPVISPL
jgi:hypothetical protein